MAIYRGLQRLRARGTARKTHVKAIHCIMLLQRKVAANATVHPHALPARIQACWGSIALSSAPHAAQALNAKAGPFQAYAMPPTTGSSVSPVPFHLSGLCRPDEEQDLLLQLACLLVEIEVSFFSPQKSTESFITLAG